MFKNGKGWRDNPEQVAEWQQGEEWLSDERRGSAIIAIAVVIFIASIMLANLIGIQPIIDWFAGLLRTIL